MSARGKIKSYKIILETLNERKNVTINIIKDILEREKLYSSVRTVQRLIEELRFEFSIDINYNNSTRNYELKEEQSDFLKKLHLFKLLAASETYEELLKNPVKKLKHIDFDVNAATIGIEYFHSIFKAIDEKSVLILTYQAFHKQQAKEHKVCPLLLKEYLNRWYLLGRVEDGTILLFGLDRIRNISVTKKKFLTDKKLIPAKTFENIIGVTITDNEVKEIILSFTAKQGNYIRTQPLHSSQEILIDDDKEFRIRLYLQPNYEIKALILSHGPEVIVVEPVSLRKEIKQLSEATSRLYK